MNTKEARSWVHLSPKVLLKARQAQGWSRKQVAEAVGVSQGAVQNWEAGKSTPTEDMQQKLVQALHVDGNGTVAAPAGTPAKAKAKTAKPAPIQQNDAAYVNAAATIVAALINKGLLTNVADVDSSIINVMGRLRS